MIRVDPKNPCPICKHGKHNERFIIILDIDRIFSADELIVMTEGCRTE